MKYLNERRSSKMAYSDLPIREKAQVIRMGVHAGLKSLKDIQSFYDSTVQDVETEPLDEFAEGGSIHIKHPGRLTALKKRTGKSEAELWATGNAHTRKMITFARNARKWKHAEGGELSRSAIYPFSYEDIPAVRYADGGDTTSEFLPSDTIQNRQVWLNKGTSLQKQRPGTVNLQNIREALDSAGSDIQYIWDSPTKEAYTAYQRNPNYRAPLLTASRSAASNIFDVPAAQYPKIQVSVPQRTFTPSYTMSMVKRIIPAGNWVPVGGENNGVAGYQSLRLENTPYYGIEYMSVPGSIEAGEGSIVQTDSLIKGISEQELGRRILEYKNRLGGKFIPSDM